MFKKSLFTKSNPLLLAKQLGSSSQQPLPKAAVISQQQLSNDKQAQQARSFHTNTALLRDHTKGRQRNRFLLKITNYLRPNPKRRKRSLGNINFNRKQAGITLNQNDEPLEGEEAEVEEEIVSTDITLQNLLDIDEQEIMEAAKTLPPEENTFVQFVDYWVQSGRDPNEIFQMSPDELEQYFDPDDALVYIAQLSPEEKQDLHAEMSFKLYPYLQTLNQFEIIDNDAYLEQEADLLNLGDPHYNLEEIHEFVEEQARENDLLLETDATATTAEILNLGEAAAAETKKALGEDGAEPLIKPKPAEQTALDILSVGDVEDVFRQVDIENGDPELEAKFDKLDEAIIDALNPGIPSEIANDLLEQEAALKGEEEEVDEAEVEAIFETEAEKIEAKKSEAMLKATPAGEVIDEYEEEGEVEDNAPEEFEKELSEIEKYAAEYDMYDELEGELDDLEIETAVEDFMTQYEANMDETDEADIEAFEKIMIEKGVDPAKLDEDLVENEAEKFLRTEIAQFFNFSQEDCDDILADAGLNVDEDAIMKSVENLFDIGFFESTPQMKEARRRVEAARAIYIPAKQRNEMWSLHKADPIYWTGERLARSFGTSRNNAWRILLEKEKAEAEATKKPFCAEKVGIIFEKEINKMLGHKKHLPKIDKGLLKDTVDINNVKSEAEVYKQFLDKSIEADYTAGHDDSLPEWVKRPFQLAPSQQTAPKQATSVKRVATQNPIPSHGTLSSKYPIMITEMSRHVKHTNLNDRAYLVKEIDGTLRTASEEEKKYMLRRGPHVKQTKWGLGGKAKRKALFRQRRIEKLKV